MKQYCLGHETLVFGASNNIVWQSETILFRGINIHLYPLYGMFMQRRVNEYS